MDKVQTQPESNKATLMPMNWAGNIQYTTNDVLYPNSLAQLIEQVSSHDEVKVIGTRHSFSSIADTAGTHISLSKMPDAFTIDRENMTAKVAGHLTYGYLAVELQNVGLAVHNLASLPHISIAGAISTATHGSGVGNQNLAGAVLAFDMLTADGTLHTFDRRKDADQFNGAVIGLGALGIVTSVTLQVEPSFNVKQYVFTNLPVEEWMSNFDNIMGAAYSVSLFTDWSSMNMNQVWLKCRKDQKIQFDHNTQFYGAETSFVKLHPIPEVSPVNCTEQLGIEGPWLDRIPHFRMDFMPSAGSELQSEYLLPRKYAVEALSALGTLRDQIAPVLLISEIRTIASDPFWMSTAFETDSIAIHFTWKDLPAKVWELLPKLEAVLVPFRARPHWGKLFTTNKNELDKLYPKINCFRQLVKEMDPSGKFQNEFLRTIL